MSKQVNLLGRRRVLIALSPVFENSAERIIKGFSNYMSQHERWAVHWDDALRSLTDREWFVEGGWDGVVSRHANAFQVGLCRELKIPLIDINNCEPYANVANVELDNVKVGRCGAAHFIERGFQHFGFFGYKSDVWALDRREGFVAALEESERSCALLEPDRQESACPDVDSRQREEATRWLLSLQRPLAVMACQDDRARLLMEAADSVGLRVPEDVAILGANDDVARCELACPPLSSVGTNHIQSGYNAAHALHQLMGGEELDRSLLVVEPSGVVVRHSTDVLAVDDRKLAKAVQFIEQNACCGLTVPQVAAQIGMARTQLEQRFRRYFSRSPQSEIRRVQLERVRRLLEQTDDTLQRIAEQAGFAHTEYLSVFFKREVGETPGRYRRRFRKILTRHR